MDQLVTKLQETLRSGAAVVVAGAGVSVAASGGQAQSWDRLLAAGINWCAERVSGLPDGWVAAVENVLALGDVSSMLAVAQMITDKMGGRDKAEYREFLYDTFHDLPVVDARVPRAITALGVPIVTTNYDSLIEQAVGWDRATWLDPTRLQQIIRRRDKVVAHLHGHWVEPESVVLGIRSYDELLSQPGAQGLARALTTTSSLVLIGMGEGANDPNWSALRSWMRTTIPDTVFPHFRLCRSSEVNRLRDEHRNEPIKPVVYGDRFEDLADFLESLAPDAAEPQRSAPATDPGAPADGSVRARPSNVVITVGQSGREDYKTINEALQAAPSGAQLNIRPGNYMEELQIDKPVTIAGLGESPGDVKVIGQHGHTVQWTAPFGRVRNISLRQIAKDSWYCLDIVSGRLDMDHCDVTSDALACLAIHSGADPLIRNTEIHDGSDVGIHVLHDGQGTIVDCRIREFQLDGVRVDGGRPTIRRTSIVDARQYGLFITKSASGTFEDNTISHCLFANVAVSGDADPVLRRNKIHNSSQQGVNVYDRGRGKFEENKIYRNAYSNVEVSGGSVPSFWGNEVSHGYSGGLTITNESGGEYRYNQIFNNAFSGIYVDQGSAVVVANNTIRENGRQGLFLSADSSGKIDHNDVSGNAEDQIVIATEALAKVEQDDNQVD